MEKAHSLIHKNQADLNQLLTQLETAKDVEDLNKFVHFDFPRSLRRFGEHHVLLTHLLDEHESFQVPFSKLFRPFNQMEISLARAQAGTNYLQLASVRKEPFKTLQRAAKRICTDLEHVKESNKELERLLIKR